jgi:phosphatidylserine/phosphatidylglycerophosphate/cardiolipin synthase-like enzyme
MSMMLSRLIAEAVRAVPESLRDKAFSIGDADALLAIPAVKAAIRAASGDDVRNPTEVVFVAMRTAFLLDSTVETKDTVEFVATQPAGTAVSARGTEPVITEMINGARDEVIALGYEISDERVISLLHEASRRGVCLWVCCDRGRGCAERIADEWPAMLERPRFFYDRQREEAGPFASMHSKVLVVDGRDALISSANFTHHGLDENVELGVRIQGKHVEALRVCVRQMVSARVFEAMER